MSKAEKRLGKTKHATQRRKAAPDPRPTHEPRPRKFVATVSWIEVRHYEMPIEMVNVTELERQIQVTLQRVKSQPEELERHGYMSDYRLKLYSRRLKNILIQSTRVERGTPD